MPSGVFVMAFGMLVLVKTPVNDCVATTRGITNSQKDIVHGFSSIERLTRLDQKR